ncbi:MAG: DUF4880 domain-containing protein, partial [Pseudomonadota bacterium]
MSEEDLSVSRDIRDTAVEWRLLIESGNITPAERAEFEAWQAADPRHAAAYDRADTVWAAFGTLSRDTVHERHFKRSWRGHIQAFMARPQDGWRASTFAKGSIVTAAAFIVLGAVILPQVFQPSPTELAETPLLSSYATKIGETKTITLQDGSIITLGAASE